jgi:glyoxylase-like metal-dependent hydrolase (beta-lactamase superfamily II)
MNIELITVGPYEVNCAVVWGEKKQALIIDPGYDAADIEAVLQNNGLTVAAYLLTHGHADHISALDKLHAERPAPICMHPADQHWAFGETNQILPWYPVPVKPGTDILDPTGPTLGKQLSSVDAGFQTLETIETPGHTPGGVCYWLKDAGVCFTGDTLFKGSCGRTDLPGGDARTLTASLKKLAKTLSPETRIIAGHGRDSTMADELATNFYLQRFKP